MEKNQIENDYSKVTSLREMIDQTRANNKYNSFVYFKKTNVIFHISSTVMSQIWIRLSEGPWKPTQFTNIQRVLDDDQTISNDISAFLKNYIYNWEGDKFTINFSKKELNEIKQKIVEAFTFNWRLSSYIDQKMLNTDFKKTLSFQLIITPSKIDVLNSYTLTPLSTIFPKVYF